jgi:hypothetical protein
MSSQWQNTYWQQTRRWHSALQLQLLLTGPTQDRQRTLVLDWKEEVSMRDRMLLFLPASARSAFWPSC